MATVPDASSDSHLQPRPRWIAFLGLNIALVIVVSGQSSTTVALPVFTEVFHVSAARSVWIANSYLLVLAVLLLPFSAVADLIGYRRVYLYGLTLFIAASAMAAMSARFEMLLAARVLQGIGGAGIVSVNLALVRNIFPAARFGSAIGIIAVVGALSNTAGPLFAATILTVASWPWLFLLNVPFGFVSLAIALRMLPEVGRHSGRIEPASAILHVLTIGLLIVALDRFGSFQSDPWAPSVLLGAAMLAAVLYARHEMHLAAPLLPVALLRRPFVALSLGTCILVYQAQLVTMIVLPFMFLHLLNLPLITAGVLLTPWPIATMLTAPMAGWLADRMRSEIPCCGGIGLMVAGMAALAMLPGEPTSFDIVWRLSICGIGFAFFQTPNHKMIMESAPRERSAQAGGLLTTSRLIGQSSGTAIAAIALAQFTVEDVSLILWVAAALGLAALCASALRLHPKFQT